ncbi:hypothetical protein B0H19DRAFT_661439 [Mycena capillaripes]|nr:hypothetical protein B0H19DRAFT_661439 [Mycena capillaripes]
MVGVQTLAAKVLKRPRIRSPTVQALKGFGFGAAHFLKRFAIRAATAIRRPELGAEDESEQDADSEGYTPSEADTEILGDQDDTEPLEEEEDPCVAMDCLYAEDSRRYVKLITNPEYFERWEREKRETCNRDHSGLQIWEHNCLAMARLSAEERQAYIKFITSPEYLERWEREKLETRIRDYFGRQIRRYRSIWDIERQAALEAKNPTTFVDDVDMGYPRVPDLEPHLDPFLKLTVFNIMMVMKKKKNVRMLPTNTIVVRRYGEGESPLPQVNTRVTCKPDRRNRVVS